MLSENKIKNLLETNISSFLENDFFQTGYDVIKHVYDGRVWIVGGFVF
ncbi:MAG: hypothetical protein ABIC91_05785 [Nanoarchaeota archaeon]|nr:hypothetical protein [Nanoarchaeota archaeon]MBU1030812.1 hypothetical protein [Nanoarchaeota archaeon]MBU1850177.1 hypothetical protein [Nanoarchaeota archaeon]